LFSSETAAPSQASNAYMRSLIAPICALSLLAPACFGQHLLSFGIKGGVPTTDAFSDHTATSVDVITHSFSSSKNYVIGGTVELRLPLGFSVEADALYRPLNLTTNTQVLPLPPTALLSIDVNSVEFPILAKYHFAGAPLVSPYLEAGPIFRTVASTGSYLSNKGFAIGLGTDFKLLLLRISPELRYSRWGSDATVTSFLAAPSDLNQAEFLIGLSF
jgi:Outer membrane protein beta-barrel domain